MTETATPDTAPKPLSKAAWKKSKTHTVTLPSGAVATIELPNLAALIKAGNIPNNLIDDALKQRKASEVTQETLLSTWEFTKLIVPVTVIDPKLDPDDVDDLPIEDVEMLVGFATRNNDIDAVGHQLGGLETQKSFRKHRGLIGLDEVLADMESDTA